MLKSQEISKILILLPRQLGDVILGTPLVNALHQAYPKAEIDWWAHPMAKPILEGHPHLNQRFYYPIWKRLKNLSLSQRLKSLGTWFQYIVDSLKLMLYLRRQRYDVVIDAINYPRSSFQTWLTGAPRRISFAREHFRDWAYTDLIPRDDLAHSYLGHARLSLLKPLGLDYNFKHMSAEKLSNLHPYLPILPQHQVAPEQWLKAQGLKTGGHIKNFLALSPTHRRVVGRWPPAKYVELAMKWIQTYGMPVIWFRGPGEDDYILPLHCKLQERLSQQNLDAQLSYLPPMFSLNEAAYLVSLAQGWVGNSNGMSHVAVAVGCKTIELHGPVTPISWCHPDTTQHRFLQRQTGCVRCHLNVCKLPRRECLEDLEVDEVFREVQDLFGEPKAASCLVNLIPK